MTSIETENELPGERQVSVPDWYPGWAREMANLYFAANTCLFVIHGNVNDLIHCRVDNAGNTTCLLYTSPSPRDATLSRMPSSA